MSAFGGKADIQIWTLAQGSKRCIPQSHATPGVTISEISGSESGWWSSEEPISQNLKICSVSQALIRSHTPGPRVTIS
jgi:hypothetical protein